MNMKTSQLRTCLSTDDAHLIILFLDELKDVLWSTYGPDIIEKRQKENQQHPLDIDEGVDF